MRSEALVLEAAQGALAKVVVEVGDDADRVRQLSALRERASALVVDQYKIDALRGVLARERGHEYEREVVHRDDMVILAPERGRHAPAAR